MTRTHRGDKEVYQEGYSVREVPAQLEVLKSTATRPRQLRRVAERQKNGRGTRGDERERKSGCSAPGKAIHLPSADYVGLLFFDTTRKFEPRNQRTQSSMSATHACRR